MSVVKAIGEKISEARTQSVVVPINLAGNILIPSVSGDTLAEELEQAMDPIARHQATVGDVLSIARKSVEGKEKQKWVHFVILAQENETHPSIFAAIFMVLLQHLKDLEISSCAVPDFRSIPGALNQEEVKLRLEGYSESYGIQTRFVLY